MTTLTPSLRPRSTERPRLTFGTTMASEWKKLLTVRSTVYSALALVVLSVGMVGIVAAYEEEQAAGADYAHRLGNILTSGVSFSQLVMGVLAVLIVSNEYSTGMIQSTLAAAPRRLAVLGSKTLVACITSVVLSAAAWLISAAVALPLLATKGNHASIFEPVVLGGLLTYVLYMLIVTLFGIFVATIVRSNAGAIALVVGVLFVLPVVGSLLPQNVEIYSYMLPNSAQALTIAVTEFDQVKDELVKAAVVTAVWLAACGAGAIALFTRRDA